MTIWTMLVLGMACWVARVLFILVLPADRLPHRVRRALGCLAPATMAALVAVEADTATRGGDLLVVGVVLATAAVALYLGRRPRGLLLTVALGTAVALLLDLVVLA
jgi:branched-subunit amino acid transport protein